MLIVGYLMPGLWLCGTSTSSLAQAAKPPADRSLNATIIEACSCPMFCRCYFNSKPAVHAGHDGHGGAEHFCRANSAYEINKGHYGTLKLDGLKCWLAADLGEDFSQMNADWLEVTFESAATKAQREAIAVILSHVYPVKWGSFTVGEDATVSWRANKDRAEARLAGGTKGEIVLNRYQGMTDPPIVVANLKYFGAPRNDGFVLMPNEVEAHRAGSKPSSSRAPTAS